MDATKTQMKFSEWKKGILEVSMKKKNGTSYHLGQT
jgi:hypothetical protein